MKTLWQTLALSPETPRSDTLLTGLDLTRGLKAWRGFGWFSLVGAALGLLALIVLPGSELPKGPMALAVLLFGGIGIGFVRHARQRLALRREALLRGVVVAGSVTRHERRFNLFGSRSSDVIGAVFLLPEHQQGAEGILWRREALRGLRRGKQVLGLWLADRHEIWLPLEIGVRLEAEPLALGDVALDDPTEAEPAENA